MEKSILYIKITTLRIEIKKLFIGFTHSSKFSMTVYILMTIAVFLNGCKKFIEIPPPNNSLVTATVFNNDQSAQSAVNGLYSSMYNYYNTYNGNLTYLPGMTADEIYYFPGSNYDQFKNNSIVVNNPQVDSLWKDAYSAIYQSNAIIQGLQNSTSVSAPLKNQLIGEGEFIRAFCYFYLVNLFGDVPLVTTTDVNTNAVLPRANKDLVYQQIITDLTTAQGLLANDYSYSNNERTRVNKWAATALLARVYLYKDDWPNAEKQASAVIANTALFNLVPDLNSVFLKNSSEAIWQFNTTASRTNGFTLEGAHFIPGAGIPNFVIDTYLLNAFESGDQRVPSWVSSINYNGQAYHFPYKYKDASTSLSINGGEYYMVLRLAEQYLIRAEAEANQGNIQGALSDLNVIRKRAGLNNSTASDKPTALAAIAHERQTELFCEWGHRQFDLNRTAQAAIVLGSEKIGWKSTDALFPIPATEIESNSKLSQNPGY